MAAHLEGRAVKTLDFTGMAQKNGAVVAHVQIAADEAELDVVRIPVGGADLMLAADSFITLSWISAGRPANNAVLGDTSYSASIGALTQTDTTASGDSFTSHMLSGALSAGTYTLSFINTSASGDRTFFIDNVTVEISNVIEPASLAILLPGVAGMVWGGHRRGPSRVPRRLLV